MDKYLVFLPFLKKSKEIALSLDKNIYTMDSFDFESYLNLFSILLKDKKALFDILSEAKKEHFLFYPFARALLSAINKSWAYKSFSEFYEFSARKVFSLDYKKALSLLNINYDYDGQYFEIAFFDYLKAKANRPEQKLVNKKLIKGKIRLSFLEMEDFFARYVSTRVMESLPLKIELPEIFKEYAKKFQSIRKTKVPKEISKGSFPPCILHIIKELDGGSPSHMERFFLASFLFKINMPFESVLEIFSNSANFDENITKYQLKKIKDGKYNVFSCEKVRSLGFYCENCNVKNPLDFYYKNAKKDK